MATEVATVELTGKFGIRVGCYWSQVFRVYVDGEQYDLDGYELLSVVRKSTTGPVQLESFSSGLESEYDPIATGSIVLRGSTKSGDDNSIKNEIVWTVTTEQAELLTAGDYKYILVIIADDEKEPLFDGSMRITETPLRRPV